MAANADSWPNARGLPMKFHFKPGGCSLAHLIVLEWTGADYEPARMSLDARQTHTRAGRDAGEATAVLADGDLALTQDAAILSYLADLHPKARLLGDGSPRARAEVMRWLASLASELQTALEPILVPRRYLDDDSLAPALASRARKRVRAYLDGVDAALDGREWLNHARSIADPLLYVLSRCAVGADVDLHGLGNLERFMRRMDEDPCVRAAQAAEAGGRLPRLAYQSPTTRCTPRDRALAVVAHELRQPLGVIQMYTHLLRRLPTPAAPARVQSIADAMQHAIGSQRRIIDDLLEISRIRTGKLVLQRVEVNLCDLVVGLIARFSERCASVRVRGLVQVAESLVCSVDPLRLEQIVGNLLENAAKFSPAGSEVVLRLACDRGYARLTVSDNGRGIAPEFLPHVFGLFNQDAGIGAMPRDNAGDLVGHGGLGIGLALVHDLALAHGGFVKADSAGVDRGAEFTVWLPLHHHAHRDSKGDFHGPHQRIHRT